MKTKRRRPRRRSFGAQRAPLQHAGILLLHAAGIGGGRWRRSHQSEPLQEEDRALGGAAPDELAAFTLAVLDVNVSARVFQAAILEDTVDENSIVQHQVLVFKRLAFEAVHRVSAQIEILERLAKSREVLRAVYSV